MKEKTKKILEIVFASIIVTWCIGLMTSFGLNIPSRNRHYELFGIILPVFSFFIPLIQKNDTSRLIYWSKENIIAELITLIINIPIIIIMNNNYFRYYFA